MRTISKKPVYHQRQKYPVQQLISQDLQADYRRYIIPKLID